MSNGWNHLIAVNAEPRPQDQDEALINEVRTRSGYGPDVVPDVVILCMAGTPKERAEQIRRFFSPRVLPWG